MIFNWDEVISSTRHLQRRAWQRLAEEEGLPWPKIERQIYDIRPERAMTEVLMWTRDYGQTRKWAYILAMNYAEEFKKVKDALPGVREWLTALSKAHVPCAVVCSMDRLSVQSALDTMGLSHFFHARVTAEDGMDTLSERFLSAAVKLGRPPNQCVVFDSSPSGIVAAHNCTMKAVAIQGFHPGYALKQADLTCSSLGDLSVYNVRRLFANRGSEFMDLRKDPTAVTAKVGPWVGSALIEPQAELERM
jgi:HAD superfamily hydrolase (TIGR01509 family)